MSRKLINLSTGDGMVPDLSRFVFSRILEGKGYSVGTGLLTTTAQNQFFKIYFSNPADSGRLVYLFRIRGLGDKDAAEFVTVTRNPTAGVPVSAPRFAGNSIVGLSSPASLAEFRSEVSTAGFTGGQVSSSVLAIPAGLRWELEFFPLILRPGNALAFALDSGGQNHNLAATFYYIEDTE